MQSLILDFVSRNGDCEDILKNPPYALRTEKEGKFTLFKHTFGRSDLSLPVVREARDIIIDTEAPKVVCRPLDLFFSYGEAFADELDESTMRVFEKIDGNLLKAWHDGERWRVSANGRIDARDVPASGGLSLGLMFEKAARDLPFDMFGRMNPANTYMFEFVSPLTRLVVKYEKDALFHLATRGNRTGELFDEDIGVQKPKEYDFASLADVKAAAARLTDSEGYVARDAQGRTAKIKSPWYVNLHTLTGDGDISARDVLRMWKERSLDDFLAVYPEYSVTAGAVMGELTDFLGDLGKTLEKLSGARDMPRKEAAELIFPHRYRQVLFAWLDGRFEAGEEAGHLRGLDLGTLCKFVFG
jgi:T4 RnlA family RNA ligase